MSSQNLNQGKNCPKRSRLKKIKNKKRALLIISRSNRSGIVVVVTVVVGRLAVVVVLVNDNEGKHKNWKKRRKNP